MKSNLKTLIKTYPFPAYVLLGILVGIFVKIAFKQDMYAHYIWFATLILGGAPIVFKTIRGIFKGEFASDIVAMLAILTAAIMDQAFAGAVVVLMQSGGEALESFGLKRASSSLDALLARAPQFAFRKRDESIEKIPVENVEIDDILVVRPGDLIPVDGVVFKGTAEIDESAITGEPLATIKKEGAFILSGSVDVTGAFEMQAKKLSKDSQYAKIVTLVRKAQEEKAPIQRLADQYAIYFTPLTLLMALIGYLITRDAHTILSVLVVATPCPLILATPVAVLSGISRAAEVGIIVKGGAPIEQIGKAQIAVFDKTGTITYGIPRVKGITALNGTSEEDLLYKVAAVEQLSTHSVAESIKQKGLERFKTLPLPSNFKETPGRGVEADLNGEHIHIGSQAFLEESLGALAFSGFLKVIEEELTKENLLIFIAINNKFSGFISFTDEIRTGVPALIQYLHSLGVEQTMMLTGDSQRNAEFIAKKAGIHNVKASLLPEQKVEVIKKLKSLYKNVIMVGDGINDAPALATATVGIAMGAHGTAISAEAAEIVLLVDDVTKVGDAVAIGQRMLRIAKQSILIGMGLSFCLMVVAALGHIEPAIGALLQEIIDAAVILNALRAR